MEYAIAGVVIGTFGLLAVFGERIQAWLTRRKLSRHKCHTRCTESRWCCCGCRDGMGGDRTGTRCATCGTQFVQDDEEYTGPWSSGHHVPIRPGESEITQENPVPRGFTSWGWERDREFRRARYEDRREDGE